MFMDLFSGASAPIVTGAGIGAFDPMPAPVLTLEPMLEISCALGRRTRDNAGLSVILLLNP
ncbi:MAG: hypothetical protein HGA60_00865 [Chlorobiaceae bacterium]|nr:hypothetical protein [Chlorobiaceae bacterium]